MDGPLLWYLNRSTGFVVLALLTLSVVLGVLSTGGKAGGAGKGLPRFVSQSLHRNVSLLAMLMLAAHIVSAVVDTFVDIRWWQAFVPFGATYMPLWLELGTLSFDLMLVITLTSLVRSRMKHRSWRMIHLLSYLSWGLAVVHGVKIGTDMSREQAWGLIATAVCVGLVVLAGGWRLLLVLLRRDPVSEADRSSV